MNRRKALFGLAGLGGVAVAAYAGMTWKLWNKKPDLFFLENSKDLIHSLVETIIPKTDTPGAGELNIHEFVIRMVKECSEVKAQNKFLLGLTEVESYCNSEFDKSFSLCTQSEKIQTMRYMEDRDKLLPGIAGKAQHKFLGRSFFATLKEYTTLGYFTSQPGSSEALRYVPIPGRYIACEKISPSEKAWATN